MNTFRNAHIVLFRSSKQLFNLIVKYLMEIPFFYKIVQIVLGGQGHKEIKNLFCFGTLPEIFKHTPQVILWFVIMSFQK